MKSNYVFKPRRWYGSDQGFSLPHIAPGWEQVAGQREQGGIKQEEERIKEVFEVVHYLNLTPLGWQSLNWIDEEVHGWMDAGRKGEVDVVICQHQSESAESERNNK